MKEKWFSKVDDFLLFFSHTLHLWALLGVNALSSEKLRRQFSSESKPLKCRLRVTKVWYVVCFPTLEAIWHVLIKLNYSLWWENLHWHIMLIKLAECPGPHLPTCGSTQGKSCQVYPTAALHLNNSHKQGPPPPLPPLGGGRKVVGYSSLLLPAPVRLAYPPISFPMAPIRQQSIHPFR